MEQLIFIGFIGAVTTGLLYVVYRTVRTIHRVGGRRFARASDILMQGLAVVAGKFIAGLAAGSLEVLSRKVEEGPKSPAEEAVEWHPLEVDH